MRERFVLTILALILLAAAWAAPVGSQQEPQKPPPAPPPVQQQQPSSAPQQAPALQPPARPTLSVVVLDAAHGGPDAGARGATGVLESEVVLSYARTIRAELDKQGLRVVPTRHGNENPTFDERSTVANAQRGALFITLHVSSTGPAGTVRVYSVAAATPGAERSGLIPWEQAQDRYAELSRRLAELVQVQLGQKFRGSPEVPAVAPVRQLRTVAAPAIAIEVSSVSALDREKLEQMAPPLAEAMARAIAAFRPLYEIGVK